MVRSNYPPLNIALTRYQDAPKCQRHVQTAVTAFNSGNTVQVLTYIENK